jgi:hypothetical protein
MNRSQATRRAHELAATLVRQYLDEGFTNAYDENNRDASRVEAALWRLVHHLEARGPVEGDPELTPRPAPARKVS